MREGLTLGMQLALGDEMSRLDLKAVRQNGIDNTIGLANVSETRMWANIQRDGRPAEYKWRPLFNAAKFG